MKCNFKIFLIVGAMLCSCIHIQAQNNENDEINDEIQEEDSVFVIPPLFEYVIAPEDLPDLKSRTDYLMDHFWDPFDFSNTVVDQNALNHAFGVYVQAMPFASPGKVEESIKNVIKKIKNNPGLSYQFAKAAEENLYGPRAEIWGDAVCIQFLQNAVDNKKVRDAQKQHFRETLALLKKNTVGESLPEILVTSVEGTEKKYDPHKEFTLIEFTPSFSEDRRYTDLKLDISGIVNDLLEEGRLGVDIIVLDRENKYEVPDKWHLYFTDISKGNLDLRLLPGFFLIGKDKKILGKNMTVDDAINLLEVVSRQ